MQNRQFVDIAVAAKRWREVQRRRLEACRAKRKAQEASAANVFIDPRLRAKIDAAVASTRREERKALKALAKLCDQAMPVQDIMTVDEVQALPRLEARSMA